MCSSYGLVQKVRGHTLGKNLLDLVLTNDESVVSNVKIIAPVGSSDHAALRYNLKFAEPKMPKYIIEKDYNHANADALLNYFFDVDW